MKRPLLLLAALLAAASPRGSATGRPYTMLFVFGDSYSDTGAGFVDSNGPTAVAYLAQRLGIPFTYFGDPNAAGKGLNFAVSGAKTGAGEGTPYPHGALLGRGMRNQVDSFAALVRSGKIKFNPAQTMFFFAGGLNDSSLPDGVTRSNLEAEIDTLYALGARRFEVALLPTKIPSFSRPGLRFNPELARIPGEMRTKDTDIQITNSQWGPFFDQVLEHGEKYGFTDTTTACAQRSLNGEEPHPCASPETHFFFNPGHPSTAAHKAVGDMLYAEALAEAH